MTTLKEIATTCELPESTLRVYRDEFNDLIATEGEGRRRRYDEEGVETLRRIVDWKRDGWTGAQIRDALEKEREPRERSRRRNADERLEEINARLTAQDGQLAALRVEVGFLRTEIARLVDVLQQTPVTFEDALQASNSL